MAVIKSVSFYEKQVLNYSITGGEKIIVGSVQILGDVTLIGQKGLETPVIVGIAVSATVFVIIIAIGIILLKKKMKN